MQGNGWRGEGCCWKGATMSELPTSWAWAPLAAVTSDAVQKEPASEEQFFYIDIGSVDRNTKQITWPQALVGNDAPSRARKLIRTGDRWLEQELLALPDAY